MLGVELLGTAAKTFRQRARQQKGFHQFARNMLGIGCASTVSTDEDFSVVLHTAHQQRYSLCKRASRPLPLRITIRQLIPEIRDTGFHKISHKTAAKPGLMNQKQIHHEIVHFRDSYSSKNIIII